MRYITLFISILTILNCASNYQFLWHGRDPAFKNGCNFVGMWKKVNHSPQLEYVIFAPHGTRWYSYSTIQYHHEVAQLGISLHPEGLYYKGAKINTDSLNKVFIFSRTESIISVPIDSSEYDLFNLLVFDSIDNESIWNSKLEPLIEQNKFRVFINEKISRIYNIDEKSLLELTLPAVWNDEIIQNGMSYTITFSSSFDTSGEILVSILRLTTSLKKQHNEVKLKEEIYNNGVKLLSTSMEKELTIQKIEGVNIYGFCHSLTDKSTKPGEYKYLNQGAMIASNFLITFSILTNTKDSEFIYDGFKMLASVKEIK